MARVCLTEKQRQAAAARDAAKKEQKAVDDMYLLVRNNMVCKMNLEDLTQEQAGKEMGICHPSVSKLLHGKDLQVNIKSLFKIFYWLGLEVRPRDTRTV